jgi:hypothetical protein
MAICEWKMTVVYLDDTGDYDAVVWERQVTDQARGKWVPKAHLKVYCLEGHVSPRSRFKDLLVRLAASLPST